eukprot:1216083-Alexandrium_andersonii.AAC.1
MGAHRFSKEELNFYLDQNALDPQFPLMLFVSFVACWMTFGTCFCCCLHLSRESSRVDMQMKEL